MHLVYVKVEIVFMYKIADYLRTDNRTRTAHIPWNYVDKDTEFEETRTVI